MSAASPVSIILKYLDASQKEQIKKFTVSDNLKIKIGRGDTNDIAFDLNQDSISRDHCVISVTNTPDNIEISDLHSKNGTLVNNVLITKKTVLKSGDVIKLGKNGPALNFTLDPLPASQAPKTRLIDTAGAKETKMHTPGQSSSKNVIGKQTMQHMLQQSEKKGKKGLIVTALALLIVVVTAGWMIYSNKPVQQVIVQNNTIESKDTKTLSPVQINKENEKKVVFIELGWKLQLTSTGDQLYHVYLPDGKNGKTAAYIRNNQNAIEPFLATKGAAPEGAQLIPIGGFGSGTGFVVDERGFIITNRHVAAAWLTSYQFPPDAFPGVLVTNSKEQIPVYENQVQNWVPAEAMNYNRQMLETGVKYIDGASAYLDVTFANNSLRTPAKIVRISNVHDVAMIKIELPEILSKVDMHDNYNQIETGSAVVVMGYPGLSPDQYVANRSQDGFNRNPNIVKVPVPTLSAGNVGRLVKGRAGSDKVDDYHSTFGDYYQLTINSSGPGNSGGPTFDDLGRVIGIYSAGSAKVSYSIPIKYAIELMGRQEVIN